MLDGVASYSQQFKELAAGWNEIELRLKEAEHISDTAIIPAINELRYAGRRLADILEIATKKEGVPDKDLLNEHVQAVGIFFKNAKHDIVDAITAHIARRMRFVMRKYPLSDIERLAPEFVKMKDEIDRIEDLTAQSRKDRNLRAQIYDQIGEDVLPKVMRFAAGDLSKAEIAFVMLDRYVRLRAYVLMFIFTALAVACGVAVYNMFPHSSLWVSVIGVVGSLASVVSICLQWQQIKNLLPTGWGEERSRR